jgi:hypothetical protein
LFSMAWLGGFLVDPRSSGEFLLQRRSPVAAPLDASLDFGSV